MDSTGWQIGSRKNNFVCFHISRVIFNLFLHYSPTPPHLSLFCKEIINLYQPCKNDIKFIFRAFCLQPATTATSLPSSAVVRHGGNILNTANFHPSTSKSTEGRLSTRSWGFGLVTTLRPQLDVKSSNADLLL